MFYNKTVLIAFQKTLILRLFVDLVFFTMIMSPEIDRGDGGTYMENWIQTIQNNRLCSINQTIIIVI